MIMEHVCQYVIRPYASHHSTETDLLVSRTFALERRDFHCRRAHV